MTIASLWWTGAAIAGLCIAGKLWWDGDASGARQAVIFTMTCLILARLETD